MAAWQRTPDDRSWVRFAVVGSIGFVIDGGLLTALVNGLGLDAYSGRLISFAVAVSATWALNRSWTFADAADRRPARQYGLYFLFQALGAGINLAVYAIGIQSTALIARLPVLGLALGSLAALAFNYMTARYLVFVPTPAGARRPSLAASAAAASPEPGTDNAT